MTDASPDAPVRFPVESGHIMMFARAMGDPNPIYYDPAYAAQREPAHIIAPPTFASASAQFDRDYPLRPKIGQPWIGSGKDPTGVVANGKEGEKGLLHAEQHFVYHRHIKPGDVLIRTRRPGAKWSREGRRGGTLQFQESISEYRDESGDLVVTSRSITVRTSRPARSD